MPTSFFLLTINPNYSFISHTKRANEEFTNKFTAITDELFAKHLVKAIESPSLDAITGIRYETGYEIGKRYKWIHNHILLEINHNSEASVRLNFDKIREYLNKSFEKKIHLNIRKANSSYEELREKLRHYLYKNVEQ